MTPLPKQKPRLALLPALLFAGGLGVSMHYGLLWYRLPAYSAEDIAQSAELNLALDLRNRDALIANDPAAVQQLRLKVRAEVQSEIDRETAEVRNRFIAGIAFLIVGLAQMLFMRFVSTR